MPSDPLQSPVMGDADMSAAPMHIPIHVPMHTLQYMEHTATV